MSRGFFGRRLLEVLERVPDRPGAQAKSRVFRHLLGSGDVGLGKETFQVVVDQELASLYGLSERDVGLAVRTAIDGLLADEVSIDETQVEIVIRYRDGVSLDRGGLGSIPITTQTGSVVRLDEVAEVVRTREAGSLRRRDNQRQIEVQADLETDTVSVSEINAAVLTHWGEQLAPRYEGVELAFGGETEDFNESLRDLIPAFGLVVGLIFVVLALQFRSYLQPLIILSAIPFGIIGAVWGLFLMGYDLSLFAFFGIVALAGIVVNDSLVMVAFINKRVAEGAAVPVATVGGDQPIICDGVSALGTPAGTLEGGAGAVETDKLADGSKAEEQPEPEEGRRRMRLEREHQQPAQRAAPFVLAEPCPATRADRQQLEQAEQVAPQLAEAWAGGVLRSSLALVSSRVCSSARCCPLALGRARGGEPPSSLAYCCSTVRRVARCCPPALAWGGGELRR